MPQLVRIIGGSINQQCLELNRSHIARYMEIGPEWSKLRIGVLWAVNASGAGNITGTPRLGVGVCSDLSNPYGSLVPDHWVGALSNSATWGDNTNVYGATSFSTGFSINAAKVVAGTTTINASAIGGCSIASTPGSRISAMVVEISKLGANFSIRNIYPTDTPAAQITTSESLRTATEAAVMAALKTTSGSSYTLGTAQTIAVDEASDGLLNAININFNISQISLQIYDLFYAKM